MLTFPQNITSILISILGTIVAILLLTGLIVWGIKELIIKKPIVIKTFLIVLFICMVLSFIRKRQILRLG